MRRTVLPGLCLLIAACGDAAPGGTTAAPTSQQAAVTTEAVVQPSTTTVSTDPTPVTPTTATDASSVTSGHNRRATGSGVAIVDGVEQPVEIHACGWSIGATDPRHPGGEYENVVYLADQGSALNFHLFAVAWTDDGRVFEIGIIRRGDVGAASVTVTWVDPADPTSVEGYSNGQLFASAVTIDGNRLLIEEPVSLRGAESVFESVPVEFTGTCDTMGGALETNGQIAAEILGITLSEIVGTITLDDVVFQITETQTCIVAPEGGETSGSAVADGLTADFEFSAGPGLHRIFLFLDDGRVFQLIDTGGLVTVTGAQIASNGSLAVAEALGTPSNLEFEVECVG